MGDDIGYNILGINGGQSYTTPNLDSLAKNGINFTECHATPSCSPSRVMLLTGKYNFRNYTQWAVLDTSQKTIANMFQDAGYQTGCFGKWQLAGGDASIKKFGFDDYCVFNPFSKLPPRYKNPQVYANGNFLPSSLTNGKYGEDIFFDSLSAFIEKNRAHPFFIYYPMVLAHPPYQPTPDDSAFASWNSTTASDTTFYPSMISYMDKIIGELKQKLQVLGIADNTVIIYSGDNGTPRDISEEANNEEITGGKGSTTEMGTHVPLIVNWPGTITGNQVNNDLIDFTDFFPTLASIAGITLPTNYGPLDGVNFAPRLTGYAGTPRNSLYYYYDPHPGTTLPRIWAQTSKYKLYDTSATDNTLLFYNIVNDINEEAPLQDSQLTPAEDSIKQYLLSVLNHYIEQGSPLFSNITLCSLSDTSVVLRDSIMINGGSTVSESGFVVSTTPAPTISSPLRFANSVEIGAFRDTISKLLPDQIYYARAYTINRAGTSYSNQISFKTLLKAPIAEAATITDNKNFIANWQPYSGANTFQLDVSTTPYFSTPVAEQLNEGFNNGKNAPGWNFEGNFIVDDTHFGASAPSLVFNGGTEVATTPSINNGTITQLKFWMKSLSTLNEGPVLVEGYNGDEWIPIKIFYDVTGNGSFKIINTFTNPPLPKNIIQFRFTNQSSKSQVALDDVTINYTVWNPSVEPGYNNLSVEGNSKNVTGLKTGGTYYYRLRATSPENISVNSNIIKVALCNQQIITGINIEQEPCINSQNGEVEIMVNGNPGQYKFKWQGPNNFTSNNNTISQLQSGEYYLTINSGNTCTVDTIVTLNDKNCDTSSGNNIKLKIFPNPSASSFHLQIFSTDDEPVYLNVYDLTGKRIYTAHGDQNELYEFGNNLVPGIYFVNVIQGKNSKSAKIIRLGK
ncbi:MAG: sulfatase-like hydrolase/transferase [Bacteroidetes bacterium]|nr:sulfatase-like hydrolase/transferase [Bacteroidota bacterium]